MNRRQQRRLKRSEPVRKSTKSASEPSAKVSETEPDSAEISDFLYVDRQRVSLLYSQLFAQGTLTGVKTTKQSSFVDDTSYGSDVKFFKVDSKSGETGTEGIEHAFDASWSIPLEVLARLEQEHLILHDLSEAQLGSIASLECHMRVIDFASMEQLWDPALKIVFAPGQPSQAIMPELVPTFTAAIKAMPSAIHAHYLSREGFLWSSLLPSGLTIPSSDLTLKWGGTVSGVWNLLCIIDAFPDLSSPPDTTDWSGGDVVNSILSAMHGMRSLIGRPPGWVGVTPLMIFRKVPGKTA